jgi:TPR repeat protein
VRWYQKAADHGWTNAFARLGGIYGDENSHICDPKKSFRFTQRAAKAGDINSQVILGFNYVEGLGVATNSDKGLRWIGVGISAMEDLVAMAMARTNARFEAVARQVDILIEFLALLAILRWRMRPPAG